MTIAEENYIKAIYKLSRKDTNAVSTNKIAREMCTSAASVTDMIRRLADKKMLGYEKYKGVKLTENGQDKAKSMIRNHRLWEVFLVEKLNFGWDEIHDIAEELEHIDSVDLITRLDNFLGNPKFDPHGDPIPDAKGKMLLRSQIVLAQLKVGATCTVVGVNDSSSSFLQYLDKLTIGIGTQLVIKDIFDFDASVSLQFNNIISTVSALVAKNIYVSKHD